MIRWLLKLISPERNKSAVKDSTQAMAITAALKMAAQGENVTRVEWGDKEHYIAFAGICFYEVTNSKNGTSVTRFSHDQIDELIEWFSHNRTGDYVACDWIVV